MGLLDSVSPKVIHLLHADLGAALVGLNFQSLLQLMTPPLLLHQSRLQLLHLRPVLPPLLLDLDQTQNLVGPRCLRMSGRIEPGGSPRARRLGSAPHLLLSLAQRHLQLLQSSLQALHLQTVDLHLRELRIGPS